jgi:hypothetical protein
MLIMASASVPPHQFDVSRRHQSAQSKEVLQVTIDLSSKDIFYVFSEVYHSLI